MTNKFILVLPDEVSQPDALYAMAGAAARARFEAVAAPDHLMAPPSGLECWTLLGAIAYRLPGMRVTSLVSPFAAYHPAQFAKRVATMDLLTDGRITVAVGSGDFPPEFRAFGIRSPRTTERNAQMREWMHCFTALLESDEPIDFDGRWYQLRQAQVSGMPVQKPRVPIWLGGDSDGLLDIVGRFGDGWNTMKSSHAVFRERRAYLEQQLELNGREIADVGISVWLKIIFDDAHYREIRRTAPSTRQFEEFLAGEVRPEGVKEFVEGWNECGVRTFAVWVCPATEVTAAIDVVAGLSR